MPSLLVASPPPPRPAPPTFLPISSSSYISTSTMASNHRLSLLSTPELGHNTFYVAPPASSHASSLPPSSSSSSSAASASPLADGADPWCISAKQAMDNAVCHDWLYRYEPPSFALARAWKRRVVALVDRSVLVYKSTKATCAAREHFLLTEDTLIFVTEAFKKGCVIEMRKPLCKWYLRCENVDQMKRWLTTMKKAVACLKLGLPGPLTASMLASLTLTDDARLLIDTPLPNTPTTPSLTPNTRLQTRYAPLLASTNQNTTYKRQSYQVSASNITSPVMAHAHTVSHVRDHAKRASTPVFPQHILRSPLQTPSSSSATAAKRQSLAQIPDWEKQLPPQLPPPTSTLPPLPFAVPIPAQRRQTPSLSASPTSITTTNQPLTTVSEIEIIDPDLHHQ
ncbi:hypothetical protein BC940DRAFT_311311 [Gongronella butleri]|nr:hypothetical protein BC940DRAFT_311311 [Gongronella butleri]